jgi:hypothetical protein
MKTHLFHKTSLFIPEKFTFLVWRSLGIDKKIFTYEAPRRPNATFFANLSSTGKKIISFPIYETRVAPLRNASNGTQKLFRKRNRAKPTLRVEGRDRK